jgi:hypothetical protein
VPPYADMIISLMRSVMKPKIAARVSYCCSDVISGVLLHAVTKQPRQCDEVVKVVESLDFRGRIF